MAVRDTSSNSSAHGRYALIIANSTYDDPDLQNLAAAGQDADAFSAVLKNMDIGGFEVKILKNEPSYKVTEEIETFFSDRYRDDLLLLYFSCHGIKDVDGRLYYASINTRRKLLASTGVSANFVNDVMLRSRSRRQLLMIDCCYGGAFARGMLHKADKVVHTGEQFGEGRGRIVLTASDAMQYSFEGDRREGIGQRSVFTHAVVQGLETGEADIDKNGHVSYTELYNYAFERVIDETPMQKPGMWVFGLEGDVVVARNPHTKKIEVKSPDEQDPNDLILDAEENLKKGNYSATIEYTDRAIKINPRFAVAYNIQGQALFNLKQIHEALLCYEKALKLRPKYISAINNRGLALAATGQYDKAIDCFNQSIELNPNDFSIWNYKGLAHYTVGRYEDAIESFDKATSLNPSFTESIKYKELSLSQLEKRRQQEQEQKLKQEKEQKLKQEKEQKLKQEKEQKLKQEQEQKLKQEQEQKLKQEQEQKLKQEQEQKLKQEQEQKLKQEQEQKLKQEQEQKLKQEQEQKLKQEQEQKLKQEQERLEASSISKEKVTGFTATSRAAISPETYTQNSSAKPAYQKSEGYDYFPGTSEEQGERPKRPSGFNPKLLIPIIGVVAVIGAVIAFTFLGPANQAPINEEPPTQIPSSPTPSAPADSTSQTVTVPNQFPTANDQTVTTDADKPVDITLTGSDPDASDSLTAAIVSSPSNGTLSDVNQDTGIVTYTPNPGFSGTDTFTFSVNDGQADSNMTGTIEITVNQQPTEPSNQFPTANDQTVTTDADKPVDITLTGSDPDASDSLTAAIVSSPSNGTLSDVNQDTGIVTYTPNPGFSGTDTFTFSVNDGQADSNMTGTIEITVNQQPTEPSNQFPTANDQTVTTDADKPVDITLTGSDPDASDSLTAAIVSSPSNGTLSDVNQDTGIVTYTPNPGFSGTDTFTFSVNDGQADSNMTGTIEIIVNSVS